jgi:hypothetical protein
MYLTLLESCSDCNIGIVKLTSKLPSKEEIEELKEQIGGMYCIHAANIIILELDGEAKEFKR